MTARSEPSLGEGPGYYPLRLVESEPVLLSPSKYSREKELITGKIKSFIIDNPTARELFVEEVNQFFDPYFMARLDQLIKGFFRDNDQADQERIKDNFINALLGAFKEAVNVYSAFF